MRTQRIGTLAFDRPRLIEELEEITQFPYSHAYSEYVCGGPWRSCMLWSSGGNAGDGLITQYDGSRASSRTPFADRLPYLASVVERSFNMRHVVFGRLAVISDSVIIPHKDLLEYGKVLHRLHVPLITNDDCYFSEGNVIYRMKFGEVWFFDASHTHSAASFSGEERVHLMLDFEDVEDRTTLIEFPFVQTDAIPEDSVRPRAPLTRAERDALMSLATIVDAGNYRDVFSIVIRKHYGRDGGEDFVWHTMHEIAAASGNAEVQRKVVELEQYFLVTGPPAARPAVEHVEQ